MSPKIGAYDMNVYGSIKKASSTFRQKMIPRSRYDGEKIRLVPGVDLDPGIWIHASGCKMKLVKGTRGGQKGDGESDQEEGQQAEYDNDVESSQECSNFAPNGHQNRHHSKLEQLRKRPLSNPQFESPRLTPFHLLACILMLLTGNTASSASSHTLWLKLNPVRKGVSSQNKT